MVLGSYQPGMEHEATTASASDTAGAPGRPNTTRRPRRSRPPRSRFRALASSRRHSGPGASIASTSALKWSSCPRPRRSRPLAATQGCTRCGARAVVANSRGEPMRSRGSGGNGPASRSSWLRSGRPESADPRWYATIRSTSTPHRSAAASTLPALVPTIRSTSPRGDRRWCCSAASAPAVQAPPRTPPAPSTRPMRGLRRAAARGRGTGMAASERHKRWSADPYTIWRPVVATRAACSPAESSQSRITVAVSPRRLQLRYVADVGQLD